MNDRELLELAAKVAGVEYVRYDELFGLILDENRDAQWNPLEDDGDALRLAVKLRMDVSQWTITDHFTLVSGPAKAKELHDADSYAATRRAIVRAAAAIGRSMP